MRGEIIGQTEIIEIHIDSDLNNNAEALLNQLGLSLIWYAAAKWYLYSMLQ